MASTTTSRPAPISLPRFSLAALLLAIALAVMLATVVGLAAWSLQSGPQITDAQLLAAKQAAFDDGHAAGYKQGMAKGRAAGKDAGYRRGRKDGFEAGRVKGKAAGFEKGHEAGYSEGYAAGVASVPAPTSGGKKQNGGN
jgi:hypothetical protein